MDKTVAELTQEEYEALPPREFAAVTGLLLDQDAGRIHPASSDNDLTPSQLADARKAKAQAALRAAHPHV